MLKGRQIDVVNAPQGTVFADATDFAIVERVPHPVNQFFARAEPAQTGIPDSHPRQRRPADAEPGERLPVLQDAREPYHGVATTRLIAHLVDKKMRMLADNRV